MLTSSDGLTIIQRDDKRVLLSGGGNAHDFMLRAEDARTLWKSLEIMFYLESDESKAMRKGAGA